MIFGLDGVVRRWDPLILTEAEASAGLPSGALVGAVLGDHALLQDAVIGVISDAQWRQKSPGGSPATSQHMQRQQ